MDDQQSVNIPQLLAFLLISGLAIRWFFFSGSSSGSSSGGSSGNSSSSSSRSNARRVVDEARVETVQSMFPQLGRRDIMWDLLRNGGSVQATTERILTGNALDTPPPSFQPPPPPNVAPRAAPSPPPAQYQDLITRYNLSSKLEGDVAEPESPQAKASWSQNKDERQALMRRRREEMILDARRKMQSKDKGKGVVR